MNDIYRDMVTYLYQHTSIAVGFVLGWFARKIFGRIWSVIYSVRRLGRL